MLNEAFGLEMDPALCVLFLEKINVFSTNKHDSCGFDPLTR